MSSHDLSEHPWLPRASCGAHCIGIDANASRRSIVALRTTGRVCCALLLFAAVPMLATTCTLILDPRSAPVSA